MTNFPMTVKPRRMGRPPLNVKLTGVRLTDDAKRRIEALVGPQRMAAFVRGAVDEALDRHEKAKAKGQSGGKDA